MQRLLAVLLLCIAGLTAAAFAQTNYTQPVDTISADMRVKIDQTVKRVLEDTGVPSASIAIVQKGQIVYTNAFGEARLDPMTPAAPQMRYSVGSISKQFTAASILLLQQQGKLSIDDPVAKYIPGLTRSDEVTIRMLLSHTSGYQDYWPQDYLMPPMRKPTTAQYIMDTWAKKPLDFDPGTKWQYSNTNYVIAGVIVEKIGGERLMRFLQENVFTPLKMQSVYDTDVAQLADTDAAGYIRYALGPLRPAPKEGAGWIFAAGELAMPAHDLALWDISVMNRSLLAADSYKQMFTSVRLKDGTDPHYALGLGTGPISDHAALEHSGEVSGFVSENIVFPDDKAAIVVFTNQDASSAAGAIGRQLSPLILGISSQTAAQAETQGLTIFKGLQQGQIDRALFTENCNAYFDQQALADFSSSLKPLGEPATFHQAEEQLRGGMTFRVFAVTFKDSPQHLRVTTYTMPDGKLEQYLVIPAQ